MDDLIKDLTEFFKSRSIPVENIDMQFDGNGNLSNIMVWCESDDDDKDPYLKVPTIPYTKFNGNN